MYIIDSVSMSKTTYRDVKICPSIPSVYKRFTEKKYATIFSEIPGEFKTVMHHIRLTSAILIKVKAYTIPGHFTDKVDAKI